MTKFEVLVFMAEGTKEIVVREEAPNWFVALESALSGLGMADCMANILCDVKEDGAIHVSDTTSSRRFLIREIDPSKEGSVTPPLSSKGVGREVKMVKKEELLADLFTDVMDAWDLSEKEATNFFLDLALKYIPAESGSIAKTDLSSNDLEFVACRGPKGDDVCGLKIKMGQGLSGFSAKHSCYIAVSDVQKDPRFFREISDKIGYETNSIICAPVKSAETNITFGVLQLINKSDSYQFNEDDMEYLRFISEKMAEYFHMMWVTKDNNLED
jgi:hypothetical protein